MTLQEIMDELRSDLDDQDTPFLWSNIDLLNYINHSVEILCEKGLLISDATTALYCVQTLVNGTASYAKHSKVIQARWIRLDGQSVPLTRVTLLWLESHMPTWQSLTPGTPIYFCEEIDKGKVTYIPAPNGDFTSRMIVYRYPASNLSLSNPSGEPEIETRYHRYIKKGCLWQAFQKDDPAASDPVRATKFEKEFMKDVDKAFIANYQATAGPTTVGVHRGFM